eukprot:CAMPEP_0119318670 /NCGR_PEP_ID=MMETSP1333-20130426/47134_1 /TAXON_ID=418940 /ORGANISM="Scyphosphaera apsteinii, Strain RCC1455" /LENGTH=93 /DNA_ID=CAMNT_0007324901 /DNA_START=11 /DNA_END=289 /DNA_ORIENTATION=-
MPMRKRAEPGWITTTLAPAHGSGFSPSVVSLSIISAGGVRERKSSPSACSVEGPLGSAVLLDRLLVEPPADARFRLDESRGALGSLGGFGTLG